VLKLRDVVRAAPAESHIRARIDGERMTVSFGRSRFVLATLPGSGFPEMDPPPMTQWVEVPQRLLRQLLEATLFAMAQQDVRYYLQGLLLQLRGPVLRVVATDGHRLALSEGDLDPPASRDQESILPRKTVQELRRNLTEDESSVRIGFAEGHVVFELGSTRLISKVIEGRFPDYERVIPKGHPFSLVLDREALRQALNRAGIVASDKYRGVRLLLGADGCQVVAQNTEREEAEEAIQGEFSGQPMEIAFNLTYLADVLSALNSERIRFELRDEAASALITAEPQDRARYVVMPTRL